MRSLRACHVQASVWPRDCWRKSGMIAVATSRPAVCKLWEELRPCSFKVACTPKRIVDCAASFPGEQKTLLFFAFQLGMSFFDHASQAMSREAKRLDMAWWRGRLLHAVLKSLPSPLCSQFFLLLQIGSQKA